MAFANAVFEIKTTNLYDNELLATLVSTLWQDKTITSFETSSSYRKTDDNQPDLGDTADENSIAFRLTIKGLTKLFSKVGAVSNANNTSSYQFETTLWYNSSVERDLQDKYKAWIGKCDAATRDKIISESGKADFIEHNSTTVLKDQFLVRKDGNIFVYLLEKFSVTAKQKATVNQVLIALNQSAKKLNMTESPRLRGILTYISRLDYVLKDHQDMVQNMKPFSESTFFDRPIMYNRVQHKLSTDPKAIYYCYDWLDKSVYEVPAEVTKAFEDYIDKASMRRRR